MKPVTYYIQTPAIDTLARRYGSQFQQVAREDKIILLAAIASKLATGYPLETYTSQMKTFESDDEVLEDFILRLDRASEDELLGVCESLSEQIRNDRSRR